MDNHRLFKNLSDQIKEAQLKLGFEKVPMTLYYPVNSLKHLLYDDDKHIDTSKVIEDLNAVFADADSPYGDVIAIALEDGRISIEIPIKGVEYVYGMPTAPFLEGIVELFASNPHLSLDDIKDLFEHFGDFQCEKMPQGSDFDYYMYFTDSRVDEYYYCFKEEMNHMIYHRFTEKDFDDLIDKIG